MTTYLITSAEVATYNREVRLHIDFGKEKDKCSPKYLQRSQQIAPFQRTANDRNYNWRMNAEDYWLDKINDWYCYEFPEPFVFIKLKLKEIQR